MKEQHEEKNEEDLESADEAVDGPSKISVRLGELKSATLRAIKARERLPQPLFWSLFGSEVEDIRAARREQRQLRKILYGIDV